MSSSTGLWRIHVTYKIFSRNPSNVISTGPKKLWSWSLKVHEFYINIIILSQNIICCDYNKLWIPIVFLTASKKLLWYYFFNIYCCWWIFNQIWYWKIYSWNSGHKDIATIGNKLMVCSASSRLFGLFISEAQKFWNNINLLHINKKVCYTGNFTLSKII